jgi:hypothetical protein
VRTVRALLILAGAVTTGYGGWLLKPDLATTAAWLVSGPVVHDAAVAPLVALTGLLLVRALPDRAMRWWVTAGVAVTATLALLAVPLLWRPHRAARNPGLQDRDYVQGLAVWLVVIWAVVILGAVLAGRRRRRRGQPSRRTGAGA